MYQPDSNFLESSGSGMVGDSSDLPGNGNQQLGLALGMNSISMPMGNGSSFGASGNPMPCQQQQQLVPQFSLRTFVRFATECAAVIQGVALIFATLSNWVQSQSGGGPAGGPLKQFYTLIKEELFGTVLGLVKKKSKHNSSTAAQAAHAWAQEFERQGNSLKQSLAGWPSWRQVLVGCYLGYSLIAELRNYQRLRRLPIGAPPPVSPQNVHRQNHCQQLLFESEPIQILDHGNSMTMTAKPTGTVGSSQQHFHVNQVAVLADKNIDTINPPLGPAPCQTQSIGTAGVDSPYIVELPSTPGLAPVPTEAINGATSAVTTNDPPVGATAGSLPNADLSKFTLGLVDVFHSKTEEVARARIMKNHGNNVKTDAATAT